MSDFAIPGLFRSLQYGGQRQALQQTVRWLGRGNYEANRLNILPNEKLFHEVASAGYKIGNNPSSLHNATKKYLKTTLWLLRWQLDRTHAHTWSHADLGVQPLEGADGKNESVDAAEANQIPEEKKGDEKKGDEKKDEPDEKLPDGVKYSKQGKGKYIAKTPILGITQVYKVADLGIDKAKAAALAWFRECSMQEMTATLFKKAEILTMCCNENLVENQGAGKKMTADQLHRLYVLHHTNKNIYPKKSSEEKKNPFSGFDAFDKKGKNMDDITFSHLQQDMKVVDEAAVKEKMGLHAKLHVPRRLFDRMLMLAGVHTDEYDSVDTKWLGLPGILFGFEDSFRKRKNFRARLMYMTKDDYPVNEWTLDGVKSLAVEYIVGAPEHDTSFKKNEPTTVIGQVVMCKNDEKPVEALTKDILSFQAAPLRSSVQRVSLPHTCNARPRQVTDIHDELFLSHLCVCFTSSAPAIQCGHRYAFVCRGAYRKLLLSTAPHRVLFVPSLASNGGIVLFLLCRRAPSNRDLPLAGADMCHVFFKPVG